MMEGLGRLYNEVPIAAGVYVSLKDAAGVDFTCTGDDVFTVKAAQTYDGTPETVAAISRYYKNTSTAGTAAWTDSGDITPVDSVTIASGSVNFHVDASDLPAGYEYVAVTIGTAGLVNAKVIDLLSQRTPPHLRILSGSSS